MEPINLFVAINLFVTITANFSAAKKDLRAKLSSVVTRPKTYLQKLPPNVSAVILLIIIVGIFNLGTFSNEIKESFFEVRIISLLVFIIFSWLQIFSYKSLGEFYSQEIVILKNHALKTNSYYKLIRHPQYVSQILSDLGAAVAVMSYIAIPLVILIELPLFYLRAKFEENILQKHFKDKYAEYKNKSGFFIPFVG